MSKKKWPRRITGFQKKILSNPDKRHQYDTAGFEAVETEGQDLELDLSSLSTMNTMFAAIFSKLGVPIKTTVSATVLEEALNGTVTIQPIALGQPVVKKVEKQCAHFYSVNITEKEAQAGLVCRVQSADKSKFKFKLLNLFDFTSKRKRMSVIVQDENGQILLLCKGADSIIFDRLSKNGRVFEEATTKHLNEYGEAGLRTLALAYKKLEESEYVAWNDEFIKAKTSMGGDRDLMLERVSDLMEKI